MHEDIKRIGECSKDGVLIYHLPAKKYQYVNQALATMFEVTTASLMDSPHVTTKAFLTEDAVYLQDRYDELINEKTLRGAEFRIRLSNGELRHLCCDAYLLNDDEIIIAFIKDFSHSKEHEDFIVDYGARKDTLLDMLTHNLSGPLSLSRNILRWMQETYKDKAPGGISAQLRLIQDNTEECIEIVNDFLREEHTVSQRVYVKKTRFDILEKVSATLEKLILTNKEKKFRLITDLDNLNINTDSVKFFQIVHNLMSNAIKFTPDNGEIDLLVKEKEETFMLSVRDNGIGIPKELHPNLFDKRTSSGRSGLNQESSSGLGLSIVKALTEVLGGTVSFTSEDKKGSTFSIELPKN